MFGRDRAAHQSTVFFIRWACPSIRERADDCDYSQVHRLCVCASGSLIIDTLSCRTLISVSCLHFGQNSGKFLSSVSFRIFNLVLFPQTGHNIQFSLSIFYYSPLILLLTIRGSELLQLLRLRTLHSRLYLQDNHWHTVLLFPL